MSTRKRLPKGERSTLERKFTAMGNRSVERDRYSNLLVLHIERLGLSRSEVGRRAGIGPKQFAAYCTAVSLPGPELQDRIARVLAAAEVAS